MRTIDRTGQEFGLWTVVGPTRQKMVPCECLCGTRISVRLSNLTSGRSRSCGCDRDRKTAERAYKHGAGYDDYRYSLWQTIKGKCLRETHRDWRYYGGRGITMYEPWVDDYQAFVAYLDLELGPRPLGYTLDRTDNDGNYEPGNLRWASRQGQARNRR